MPGASCRGTVDPAFAAVAEAFEDGFGERGEVGAALAVLVGGRAVVDVVGGTSDAWGEEGYGPG